MYTSQNKLLIAAVAKAAALEIEIDEDTGEVWHIIHRDRRTSVSDLVSPTATPEYGILAIEYNPLRDWHQTGELIRKFCIDIKWDGTDNVTVRSKHIVHGTHDQLQELICKSIVGVNLTEED